jgi:pimeloyl-ACP methyl ester carboxylesterase
MDFYGNDGQRLAYDELGTGRPLILIHGHQERGSCWVDCGLAGRLAERGHRVIMPDLRAHGESAKPHDAACYPRDAYADDGLALVAHLGLTDYDLGGHSLGGRTAARMLIRGTTPRRAVISGQGLDGLLHGADPDRTAWYREFFPAIGTGVFEAGSDEQETEDWMLGLGNDPQALLLALNSMMSCTAEELSAVTVPVLVLTGAEERANETAQALADTFAPRTAVILPRQPCATCRRLVPCRSSHLAGPAAGGRTGDRAST